MPIPTYDQFIDPMLRYLAKHPDGARTGEVYEALADEMGFSEEERVKITTVVPGSTARPEFGEHLPGAKAPVIESPDDRLSSAPAEINESVGACPPSLASQLWRIIGHELELETIWVTVLSN